MPMLAYREVDRVEIQVEQEDYKSFVRHSLARDYGHRSAPFNDLLKAEIERVWNKYSDIQTKVRLETFGGHGTESGGGISRQHCIFLVTGLTDNDRMKLRLNGHKVGKERLSYK